MLFLYIRTIETSCSSYGICSWHPWESWSACSVLCGGGTRRRLKREVCCDDTITYPVFDCRYICSSSNEDVDSCNEICYNDGSYNGRCNCKETNYGTCCEMCK